MTDPVIQQQRVVQELRKQLQAAHDENAELRLQLQQRDRWIRELRDALAVLSKPDPPPRKPKV